MEPQIGDRVRTNDGETGVIVFIDRLTAFVDTDPPSDHKTLKAFLVSELTKIAPPPAKPDGPLQVT